ncbi:MAG: acyl-ACP--UDP-N-acetylglucosamine O-acyltransferase [Planctomycetota bacterium]|nr:acyl-ACP--UDP-N-acetylglucosamine O-acyltransferase [Planctomycetota bacterium]
MTTAVVQPGAEVDPSAEIGEDVVIESGVYVGPRCVIGAGTRIRRRAMILQDTTIGARNDIHSFAVIGGDPQDKKFKSGESATLIVGDGNVFREHVTLNRGSGAQPTTIGNGCFFMASAHAGHNAVVGDNVILANSAVIAGHARVGDGCFMSAGSMVHQFCDVGEMVMFQGGTAISQHVPPFAMVCGVNEVAGLNRVGLQRSGRFDAAERAELKEAFRLFYRDREMRSFSSALEEAQSREWSGAAARRFIDFIAARLNESPPRVRGLCGPSRRGGFRAAASAAT